MRILRRPEVLRITGLSASSVLRMERSGRFPRHVRLPGHAVGWREDEVQEWIDSLARGGELHQEHQSSHDPKVQEDRQ
jgi:prophage regulatory protein